MERRQIATVIRTDLHQRLKVLAAQRGVTMRALAEEAIANLVRREEESNVPIPK